MGTLERRIETLQQQLKTLRSQAERARGEAQKRLTQLERQSRMTLERALQQAEPAFRRAMAEATTMVRSLRAGVKAAMDAYRKKH
jgi:hypothetical protein